MGNEKGVTLVELLVAVAIAGILAAVAIPAYINHKNRAIQGEAIEALLRTGMDQQMYWAENERYAGTIGCLASFGADCGITSFHTPNNYTVTIDSTLTTANTFRAVAQKQIYSYSPSDIIEFSSTLKKPRILNEDALHFSIFESVFD